MKKVKIIEGVVAEYNGKYWGIQYQDGHCTSKDFGDIEKAAIWLVLTNPLGVRTDSNVGHLVKTYNV